MASPAQIDYAALAEQARRSTPVDYSALAAQARLQQVPVQHVNGWTVSPEQPYHEQPRPEPGFWEEGGALHRFIHNSPVGPVLDWPETLGKVSDYAKDQMQRYLEHPGPGTIPVVGDMATNIARAQEDPSAANLVQSVPVVGPIARTAIHEMRSGDVAGGMGTATNLIPMVWPAAGEVASGAKALRTNNPDVSLANAVNAHIAHTSFPEELPNIRANVKAGEQITNVPITDVPSALENTDAAMKANRAALETHKDLQRNMGTQFDTSVLKRAMIDAIPKGLKTRGAINPATGLSEYDSAVAEINSLYPQRYVNVDQLFQQLEEANNRLSAFYSGKQGNQASKLVTNMGDTSILKAEGDAARKYLYDTMGQDAATLQSNWGEMNGFKHYLQDKVNPAFRQQPFNPMDEWVRKVLGSPTSGQGLKHGVVRNLIDRVTGVPTTIDGMIADAFGNTSPANLPQAAAQTGFSPFGGPANPPGRGPQQAQLPPGPLNRVNVLPSGSGVVTPQNPQQSAAGAFQNAVSQRPNASAVANTDAGYRSLPPATTRFQGDISPGAAFGGTGEMRDLPSITDPSGPIPPKLPANWIDPREAEIIKGAPLKKPATGIPIAHQMGRQIYQANNPPEGPPEIASNPPEGPPELRALPPEDAGNRA